MSRNQFFEDNRSQPIHVHFIGHSMGMKNDCHVLKYYFCTERQQRKLELNLGHLIECSSVQVWTCMERVSKGPTYSGLCIVGLVLGVGCTRI
jgi:hypothetical protein